MSSDQSKPQLLLATDFDGTIAPIVARPEDAIIHPCAYRLLARCAALPSVAVAVLSGRDVDDIRQRLIGLPVIAVGSHGLEGIRADGSLLWTTMTAMVEPDWRLTSDLRDAQLLLERKKFSIAVHFRDVDITPNNPLLIRFRDWARQAGLELLEGRKVIEARVPGSGKREALKRVAFHTGARRVVYAGDDLTDFEALAFAAERGRGIFVSSAERPAPRIARLRRVGSIEDLCLQMVREVIDCAPASAAALASL